MGAMVPELFISYSRQDEEIVKRIAARLTAVGITYWIDQEKIEPADNWDFMIEGAIKTCQAGLVVLSRAAAASLPVRSEFTRILNYGKPLYVALIEPIPRDESPVLLETVQRVDLTRNFDTEMKRLIERITATRAAESAGPSTGAKPPGGQQWPAIPQPQHPLLGRDKLKLEIQAQLSSSSAITLRGADGVGNTVLAAAVARDWAAQEKRVLWLVIGERDQKWNTLFQEIGQAFQMPYLSQIGWDDQCKKMRAFLSENHVDLLVLDDVRSAQPVVEFVRDLFKDAIELDWSPPPRCAVLLTSHQALGVGRELEVPSLDDNSARKLFRMRAGLNETMELDARFDLLENHPLLVEIAARMVSTGRVTLDELFDRLDMVARQGVQSRRMLHVAYQALHDDERALLDAFGANWTNTITQPILTAITFLSDDLCAAALDNLVAYSLITRRAQEAPVVEFSMHASNRKFVCEQLANDPEHYTDLQLGALSAYLDYVGRYSHNDDDYVYLDVERENVIKAAEWAATQKRWAEVSAFAENLCWESNHYLNMRGYQPYVRILLSLMHESTREREPKDQCKLLMRLGTAYRELGYYDEALKQYNTAKDIAEELGDRLLLSQVLGGRAQVHHNKSDYQNALSYFDRALRLVTERDADGRVLDGAADGAVSANKDAAQAVDAKTRRDQRAWVLSYMGVTYADMGYYEVAAMCYYEALRLRRQAGDKNGLSVTLGNIGNMLCDQGYYDQALTHYQEAFKLAREIDDRRRYGRHIGNLGNVYFHQGEYELALEKLNEALEKHQKVGDRRRQARRLSQLGNVYRDFSRSQSDYDNALALYQVSLDLAENLGDMHSQVYTLNGWGLMLVRMGRPASGDQPGDFEVAREKFERAREFAKKIQNKRGLGYALSNLGTVFVHDEQLPSGSIDQGKEYLEEGLEIAREIGNRRGEVFALTGLGNAYARRRQTGDEERAIRYYNLALAIALEMSSKRECVYALNGLGNINIEMAASRSAPTPEGRVNEALKYLKQALAEATGIKFLLGEAACRYTLSRAWTQFRNPTNAKVEREIAAQIYRTLGLDHKAEKLESGGTLELNLLP